MENKKQLAASIAANAAEAERIGQSDVAQLCRKAAILLYNDVISPSTTPFKSSKIEPIETESIQGRAQCPKCGSIAHKNGRQKKGSNIQRWRCPNKDCKKQFQTGGEEPKIRTRVIVPDTTQQTLQQKCEKCGIIPEPLFTRQRGGLYTQSNIAWQCQKCQRIIRSIDGNNEYINVELNETELDESDVVQ